MRGSAPQTTEYRTILNALLLIGSIRLLSRFVVFEHFMFCLQGQGDVNLASGVLNIKPIPRPKKSVLLLNPLNTPPRNDERGVESTRQDARIEIHPRIRENYLNDTIIVSSEQAEVHERRPIRIANGPGRSRVPNREGMPASPRDEEVNENPKRDEGKPAQHRREWGEVLGSLHERYHTPAA